MNKISLNALVWKEDKLFVAKSLEINVASQGKTKEEALTNLKEALNLFFECEEKSKISIPLLENPQITRLYV